MRKVKFAFLFVLVLCLVAGMLVACDPTGGTSGAPVIPTNPDGSQTTDSYTTMSGQEAWSLFKSAASAANAPTGNYVFADSVVYLDYIKDAVGYYYAVKVQADIDLSNDANSELLLELWQVDDEGNLAKMLVGLYYYDSTLVYDCTGLKQGAKVVKTNDINLTAIEKTLREMFNGSSLANFLLENLLSYDTGVIGTVEGLITALIGQSRLITNSDGTQRLEMPFSLTSILGTLLSGVLVPGPDGLISDDIAGLIKDILGVDLYMFEALVQENVSLYFMADLKDDADGNKVLSGMSIDVGVDFNTYDTSLEEEYGVIESSYKLSVGASTIDKLSAPSLDVVGYLTSPKAAEGELESAGGRGIESIENLTDYSLLTVDLTLSLNLSLNETTISANQIMSAFGTLISGLIPEGSISDDIAALLDKQINIKNTDRTLNIHISGGIDMFDNSGTNLLIELTGEDIYKDIRASIAYVGADDALYIDLTGLLGTGKFVIDGIDLNSILAGLVDDLVDTVKNALDGANLLPEEQEQLDEFVSAADELLADGTVLQVYGASASGEPISDTIGLIRAIFDNIDVDMAGNIFNIQAITVTLTQEILDYIWSIAFTGDLEGATIPIVGDVKLQYLNNGFATTKDITLDLSLGNVQTGNVIAGIGVGITAQFGSVIDEGYFNGKIASFSADRKNGEYITLASLDDLFDESGNFVLDPVKLLSGIESVGIGLSADINLNVSEGGLADIYYEQANEFVVALLAEFEQSFGAQATLVLKAEVTDVSMLVSIISGEADITQLIPFLNVYLALETSDGSAPLRVWFVDGVAYISTSEDLLGGLALQVDIKPFLPAASGQSEALTSDDGNDSSASGSTGVLPAELIALIASADVTVGDLYLDVALGSGLLATLLNLIGVTGLEINASGSDETLGIDAGVSIEFNDGLQISGGNTSEGLSIGIVLGVGNNFDFSVDLGGVNAVINGESYVPAVDESVEFIDFFNEPYVNLSLNLGLSADISAGNVSLGDGMGSIDFPEGMDIDLVLSLEANLDLGVLLAEFTGVVPSGENRTELALQLKNGDEVLLAVYYSAGTLYVDASTLVGARISTDLDIMSLLVGLLSSDEGEGGSASSAADYNSEDYSIGVFEFLMKVTSAGFSVKVAQGLTEIVNDLIGMNLGEINAALSFDWTNIVSDGKGGHMLDVDVSVGDKATVNVFLSGLGIGIGEAAIAESVLPEGFDASAYKNIGSLFNDNNEFDASGLLLDSVYAEISGSIDLSADSESVNDWTIGDWINNFLEGDATVSDAVKSLVQKLVLSFVIDRAVSTSIEFNLKALLRFGDLGADNAVGYILSHSDIALEIRESGASENLLAIYIIADPDTGRSTLYIASDEGGLIGGGIAVPDIDLGSLFASSDSATTESDVSGQAVSAADGTDGSQSATDNILDTILGIINSIYMTNSELEVGFGANFLVSLLNMLLPGYELNADNFIQLNPENSFLSLFYGLGESEQREIGVNLSLGADPFVVSLGLGGLKVAVNDDSYAIVPSVPDGFDGVDDYYKNIFDTDGVVSLETTIALELSFGDTAQLEDGRLPVGDMLSAIIADLALDLGVEISDDIKLAIELYVGANIWFGNPERTEIALEIRDTISGNVIIAIYLRGSAMYVDMGMLSDNDFVVENTGIISIVTEKVSELLSGTASTSESEALTATEAVAQAENEDILGIVFKIAEGHLALSVTEKVLLGIIGAFVDADVDINAIFEKLNLGAEVSVDVDFDAPSVSVNVDTNYASIGIAIKDPYIANNESENVTELIDMAIANGNFQSYSASSVARFGLSLSVRYSADATYQEVDNPETYPNSDRYIKLPDGSFVQDNDGTYIRRGISISEIIDALLDMPALSGALGNVGNDTLQAIVDALVARLGIELYIDDTISDNFEINIEGLLDLEALGLSGILTDFTLPELDTVAILNALQVGIEIVFNPETDSSVDVGIYLQEGNVYVDLTGIGGPKISARLFEILAELGVEPFGGSTSEAVTAANGEDADGSSLDVNALLNALVRTIVLRQGGFAAAGTDGYYNMLQSGLGLDLMLPSNLVGNIVSLIVGNGEEYSFDEFILNEELSGISLVIGGGNIAIEVAAKSDTGFNIAISTEAGLIIDVATQDSTLLSSREKSTYVDMTDLVFSVIDLVNGNVNEGDTGFGSQRVTFSISGMATFESDGEGSYDLGSLLAQYLGDIVLELNTEDAFSDGIAFRLSVAADLGAINFVALAGDTPDWEAFLEKTDLDSIELALELLNIDAAGNIEQDNVLAGIYLYRGNLYIDGTGVFDVVENYSRVPNFLQFVIEAAQMASTAADGDVSTQAVSAADSVDTARDALLELIYSDTAMQIVITKSIISAVLATLLPDLGGIADIFDNFEVSLGAEIGRYDYIDIYEAGLYKAEVAEGGAYVAVTENDEIVGFVLAQDGDEGTRYTLTAIGEGDEKGDTYYAQASDGSFYRADARYNYYSSVGYVIASEGETGSFVKLIQQVGDEREIYLESDRYVFYTEVNGNYVMISSLENVSGDNLYVLYDGQYRQLEFSTDGETSTLNTYVRLFGYVRDAQGEYYRVYTPHTAVSDFYLTLGADIGTISMGLAIGGLTIDFGNTDALIPDYILSGKSKQPAAYDASKGTAYIYDESTGTYTAVSNEEGFEPSDEPIYYYDVPTLPFYDSVVTIGMSIEFELSITEGKLDVGQIFAGILGDLDGIVIEIPSTNKGYSSAHLRLDISMMLDMQNLPGSEFAIQLYNLSSESGSEVLWLAAYYLDDMLYIDLSFFNMPKVAVPMTEISDWIESDLLGDLLNTSIYDDVEVAGGASEAITADGAVESYADVKADLTTEEKVASLLISNRRLALSVGNAFMRYLLNSITIGDAPLSNLVYEELLGGLDVTIDLNDGVEVALELALALQGDRYTLYDAATYASGARYYVFEAQSDLNTADAAGLFVLDGDVFRVATKQDTGTMYVRYEAVRENGEWTYYVYKEAEDGEYVYDADNAVYILVSSIENATESSINAAYGTERYSREAIELDGSHAVYEYSAGASANPNDYDTELNLYVGVNNLDIYFTEQREYSLTAEELAEYYNFNSVDTVSFSETISLDILFDVGSEIDLSDLFEYLFPDSTYDFDTIIKAVASDGATDILRNLELTVSLEFKLGAFINYLRSLDAIYPGGLLEGITLPEEFDLVTFIQLIASLIGKEDPSNPDDDLFGLEDFLNFVNASVVLTTSSNDGTPAHTMLGVYLSLGDEEGVEYNPSEHAGQQKYSHYFASVLGNYGYVDGEYVLISEIAGGYDGVRYSRDDSYLYPDDNGTLVRDTAGLYIDLSYFGQPGVYINLSELMDFIAGMMGGSSDDNTAGSEAITAADGSLLPVDLGEILGIDVNLSDSLPLLSQEIASYIQAFLYGVRITSTYIRVFLEADFIDSLLMLLIGDDSLAFGEFEQSYIGINVDVNNYLYVKLSEATNEQLSFANTRFGITESEDGMYYLTDEGYYELRSDMTEQEAADYSGSYYDITPVETYLNVGGEYILTSEASRTDKLRAERYERAFEDGNEEFIGTYVLYVYDETDGYVELGASEEYYAVYAADEQKAFIEANIYLWNHSINLGINMPTTSGAEYQYEYVGEGGSYEAVELALYTPDYLIEGNGSDYLYYRGDYYQITKADLRVYIDGQYMVVDERAWSAFLSNPYTGEYYLLVTVDAEGFAADVLITENDVYEREVYKTVYRYVGEGNGSYNRLATTSLVSVPEFKVNFDSYTTDYTENGEMYYVDSTGDLVLVDESTPDGATTYTKGDIYFVYNTSTRTFVSVASAKEAFFNANRATYDTDDDGVVDEAAQGEFNINFAVYLRENFYTDTEGNVMFYDSEYISYSDTGELYYLNVVIRGEISLGQYKTYLTADEWAAAGYGALPEQAYVLVRGHYVAYDANNTTHNGLVKYYVYTASTSAISEVLGAILGDMSALFTVADGYEAVLPFEIRATVKLDYANETDYDSLYVAGLELAIDVWRTEQTDGTLSHILGLYYMSDVWNIGDNDITNDIINSAALYLDLTWLLGDGAKFKVDLSAYPLEDLLNDNISLAEIFGGSSASEALTATESTGKVDVGNASKASVLLNVFSRSIALKASAGLVKLLVSLIAPNNAAALEEILPNLSINAQIDAAPYDLTIGATLFDGDGNGLLDLGLTLNLFNTDDASEGLQLSFGSLEDYAALSAAQLAEKSKDYIYYYGLFTRDDSVTEDYYIKNGTGKGYIYIDDATEEQIAAAGDAKYVLNVDEGYDVFVSTAAKNSYPEDQRYAEIPAGYIMLRNADDYNWAVNEIGAQLYYYSYSLTSGRATMTAVTSSQVGNMSNGIKFIDYGIEGQQTGYAKLYINYNLLGGAQGAALTRFETTAAEVQSVRYGLDSNGAHKLTTVFNDYQDLLAIDLGTLLNAPEGTTIDILNDVLIPGLQAAGLETVEIGATLALDLSFQDALNWTRQMTRLLDLGDGSDAYFQMLLASLAMNSAEFVSAIGLDVTLALQIRVDGLIAMLPDLIAGTADTTAVIGALLAGASVYLEIAIDTNFFGEKIEGAEPIKIWLFIDDNLNADIYINAKSMGEVLGCANDVVGDFFGQPLKLTGVLNILDIIDSISSGSGSSEAVTAADSGLIIDIGDANTGVVPEDVWGVLDLLLGQVLFASDMLSVGITENLLAGLIEALVPEFDPEDLELIPTFKVTSGTDTSGISILFGDSPSVLVQLGVKGGFDDFATLDDAVEAITNLIGDSGNNIYNIDNISSYLGTGTTTSDGEVVISTEEYALAVYASPEEPWLGTRYTLGFDDSGEPVFTEVNNATAYANAFTANTSGNGLYGVLSEELTSYQGVTGGQVTSGTYVTYGAGTYMLISRIEALTGEEYNGTTYDFDEDNVVGKYVLLGDVTIALELGGFKISVNEEFSHGLSDEEKANYTSALESTIRLSTSIDVGFYGHTGADIDLGTIADLIFGIDAIKSALGVELVNNSLDVTVTGELGSEEMPYFNVALDAYIDLQGQLQIKLVVGRYDENGSLSTVLSVSLADDALYIDLSGVLGEGVKGYITNLGVEELLFNALGGVIGTSTQSVEAVTATISDTAGMTLHEYAYLAVMINPGYFSLQLTLAAIQAIIAKVGADNPDLNLSDIELPDLGDIMIESHGSEEDGAWLSLNAKLSENFGASIDIHRLYIGTEPIYNVGGKTGTEGTTAEEKFVTNEQYTYLYDVATGDLNSDLNISVSASADISMTSEGLNPGDDGYETSLAGWVIDLVTNLLGATSIFVTSYDIGSETEYDEYGGPIYQLAEDGTYELIGYAYSSTGYVTTKGDASTYVAYVSGVQYYRTTIVEATFAANEANITIDIEGDLNIGAIVTYGIGGILFSDFRVSIGLGSPFNSTILEVYYLGSSRLSTAATNNIYTLVEDVEAGNLGAFNDAIYIDATGLGLGKIKFQGLAGIFGANVGQIYDDAVTASAGTAAEGDETSTQEDTQLSSDSVSLGINIAENYIGIGIDRNLIQSIFGLLSGELGFALPDVQSLNLGLNFGDTGLSSLAIDAELDSAGTGAHIALSDFEVSLNPFVDVDSLVNQVATQFGGLTYSQTAGTMTTIASLLESLNAAATLSIDSDVYHIGMNASATWINQYSMVNITTAGSTTLSITGDYSGNVSGKDSDVPNDYMLIIDVVSRNDNMANDVVSLDVYFGNNDIWLDQFDIDLGSLSLLSGLLNGLSVSSLYSDITTLLGGLAYSDADNSTWSTSNPVATTASDDNDSAADDAGYATTASEVTDYVLPSTYTKATSTVENPYSSLNLQSLVEKVTVNLFNRNGYQPYLSGMTVDTSITSETDTSLISVKIELNKYAYNDLIMYVVCMLLSIIQDYVDTNSNGLNYFGINNGGSLSNYTRHMSGGSGGQWAVSNIFHELAYIDSLSGTYEEKVAKKMEVLSPYIECLPYALGYSIFADLLPPMLDMSWSTLKNLAGLFFLNQPIADIIVLIADILPPLALLDDSIPNPTLNIYIDLAPESSFYGISREIAPGVQAVELMVNCEKYGGGKTITQDGSTSFQIGDGYSDGSFSQAYVMSINPSNLVATGNEGEGLLSFLEADHLNGNLTNANGVDVENMFIEVDDIGTKSATMYSGTYNSAANTWSGTSPIATGTLNANFLTSNLPTSANVQLVSPNTAHDVTIIWDASAVDLSAPTTGGSRLAGFVYGYALNLVVAKIPVYVTDSYTFSSIYGYSNGVSTQISVDLTSGDMGLPDLVQINFNSGSYIYGTQRFAADGTAQYAVLKNSSNYYQYKVTDANGTVSYAYYALGTTSNETTTYELALYPAYVSYTQEGNTVTVGDVEYYVIDSSVSLPVGTIAWDLSDFSYGWDGGTVTLGFTYQWGFSAEQHAEIEVPVTGAMIEYDDTLSFSGTRGTVYVSSGGFSFSDWTSLQTAIGALGDNWASVLKEYISSFTSLSGIYVSADGNGRSFSGKSIAWGLTAIDSLTVTPGEAFSVTVTMFVGVDGDGYNIWRQYSGDNPAYGMIGAIGYEISGAWSVVSATADHDIIREAIEANGYVTVAQPVSVTISVGAEAGFTPEGATGDTEEGGTTDVENSVNTFAFDDGSATNATADGAQTYEITTSAQLYGALPESGVVVNAATGTTRAATFDWNGFVYDTNAQSNVAILTVKSGTSLTETNVIVTLADNADVAAGVAAIESATAGYVTSIVNAQYRTMVIDPFAYTTFGAYLEAKDFEVGDVITVNTTDGIKEAKVVAWSSVFAESDAMPIAGARYDDHAIIVEIDGANYTAIVPLLVIAREITDTEIVLQDGFELVNEYRRFSENVRRYSDGRQVLEITYSRDTYLPTGITVYNLYAYADSNPLTGQIKVTFADGGEEKYYTFNVAITTPASAAQTTSSSYDYTVSSGDGNGVALSGSVSVTFNAVRITSNNMDSPVAYGDLGGSADGYAPFAPYENMTDGTKISFSDGEEQEVMLQTVAGTDGQKVDYNITFYIDSKYVAVTGFDLANYPGYTVLADGDVAREYVRGSGTAYNLVTEDTDPSATRYYFIYAAVDTLLGGELTWDHSGISYNYNGGLKRTSATVQHNGIVGTVTVPIYIVSGKIAEITAIHFDTASGQSADLATDNTLTVDPFAGIDLTEVVEGGTLYKYFPYAIDVQTADGYYIRNLEVTWSNISSVRNTYRGGSFDVRLTVPASDISAQSFTAKSFVNVTNRTAEDTGEDGRGLWAETTTNGISAPFRTEGSLLAVGYADQGTATSYIDPYEFDLASFRAAVEAITEVSVYINGMTDRVKFGVAGTESAANGYTLVWSFASMSVNYLGGRVALVAQLTGPDGSTQNYEIDYLVTRKLVSNIESKQRDDDDDPIYASSINTTVGSDLGKGETYTIDPFTPSTQSLPTGWNVTFTKWNPVIDASGNVTSWTSSGTETVAYSYITVIMPSTASITAEKAATESTDAGDATMQIDGGQRLRIPIAISGKTTSSNPTRNGSTLQTKVDGVTVVWYGTVTISYNDGNSTATYNVTFADPVNEYVTVEAIEGREGQATYTLRPYIGAVINAAGKVLDWNGDVPAANRVGSSVTFTV